jgi:sugar lactone lactonase YvrE
MRIITKIVCCLSALLASGAMAAEAPHMQVDPHWPAKLPHDWVLGEVSGIAVDAQDNVWVVQRSGGLKDKTAAHAAPPVIEFDPAGNVLRAWGGPGKGYDWFGAEHGIHLDQNGFVWLSGNGPEDGQVLKFTQDGNFVLQIGHPAHGAASNDTTRLGRPTDVAIDPVAGEIYVADGYGDRRIIVFDSETGAYKRHWGAYGGKPKDAAQHYDPKAPLPRQFGRPVHCVKLAADGLVYVCDRQNDRVQIFHKDGSFVAEWRVAPQTTGMGSVWDLAFWPDARQSLIFVADGSNETVHILRRDDGVQLGNFGKAGRAPGQFHWLHTLAIDSHGDVFTTEVDGANRVQRFVPVVGTAK